VNVVVNSSNRFRIATWNLERPRQKGWIQNQRRLDQIHQIDADVWVLTETNKAIDLGSDYEAIASIPWENHHQAGENLTTIWSRWKVLRQLPTFDPHWAICAEVASPFGAMIIYGTVITYANDKGISGTAKRWEEHQRSIQQHQEDWSKIQQQYPDHLICIAGDFNQSRDGSGWYEDKNSVEMLSAALQNLSIDCVSEQDFKAQGLSRSTVDHICLSRRLVAYQESVGAWEGITSEDKKMSDHNGVFVDLRYVSDRCISFND
jgi:endonuclease/exonuclease/phosphatase family metal-dependent hydrolase